MSETLKSAVEASALTDDRKSLLRYLLSLPEDMPVMVFTPQSRLELRTVIGYANQLDDPASQHGARSQAHKLAKWAFDTYGPDNTPAQRVGGKSTRETPQVPPMTYWSAAKDRYITPDDADWSIDEYNTQAFGCPD